MTYDYYFGGRKARCGNARARLSTSKEPPEEGFSCCFCKAIVKSAPDIGTAHRNHCYRCLWSCHVDTAPGNRASACSGCMKPIGVTFKHKGHDKYGRARKGDIMLIHHCTACGHININRIAGDDCPVAILDVFAKSGVLSDCLKTRLAAQGIYLLQRDDEEDLRTGLFGKQRDEM